MVATLCQGIVVFLCNDRYFWISVDVLFGVFFVDSFVCLILVPLVPLVGISDDVFTSIAFF